MDVCISVKEAARSIGANPETIRRAIREGKLIATRGRGPYGNMISIPDFESWLEKHARFKAAYYKKEINIKFIADRVVDDKCRIYEEVVTFIDRLKDVLKELEEFKSRIEELG